MKKTLLFLFILFSAIGYGQTPVTYKIYAVRFAETAHKWSVADWADKGPEKDSIGIDFTVWLIKGSNGKKILFDTGFLGDVPDFKDFSIINYTRPDSALMKIGVKPGEITDVILSHPHWTILTA